MTSKTKRKPKKKSKKDSEFLLIHNAADRARMAGYAVVVFTPEELGDTPSDRVEDMMIEYGWNAIDIWKTEEKDEL